MSGYYDDYSDVLNDDGREEQTGGALRRQLEEVLAANKKLTERLDRMEKKGSVTSLLESKGIDPAVADLVPDGANAEEWLGQYGHLFNKAGSTLDGEELPTPNVEDPALNEERDALNEVNQVESTGTPTSHIPDPIEKLKSFQSEEEMLAFLSAQTDGRD